MWLPEVEIQCEHSMKNVCFWVQQLLLFCQDFKQLSVFYKKLITTFSTNRLRLLSI